VTTLAVVVLLFALLVCGLVGYTAYTARQVERAVPARGRFLQLDGCRIHYIDEGAGPPLFLVHGLSGNLRNFAYVIPHLSAGYRVIAVDRPGSGYSTRAASADARLAAQGDTLARVIQALKLERPLVVGHSLGGAIALALGLDHPDCVSGLALIAPLTQVVETPAPFRGLDIKSPLLRSIIAWTLAIPVGMRTADQALKDVFAPEKPSPDFMTRGGGALGLRPRSFYAASADLRAAHDSLGEVVRRYPSLTVPVGILFGKSDAILEPGLNGKTTKDQIPGLSLQLIEGGHVLPVTQPDAVAGFIRRMAVAATAQAP
jgi:pimeloyl-ACP methyl ester carboxylesterase